MDETSQFSCHPLPCLWAAWMWGHPPPGFAQAHADPTCPKPALGKHSRDLCLAVRWVQQWGAEHPWVGNSRQYRSATSLLAAAQGGAVCLALPLLPLGCSWAVQCQYQVRKQADKAGRISAGARKHPPLLQ